MINKNNKVTREQNTSSPRAVQRVQKKPFDSKRLYSSMFLLKKKLITSANYCLIRTFFTMIYIVRVLDIYSTCEKTKEKNVVRS